MVSVSSSSLCVISAVLAGYCGGLAASRTEKSDARKATLSLDEVRARRIFIVDEKDNVCGGFQVDEGSASPHVTLWLKRSDGDGPSASLSIGELEGTPEARLMLVSANGSSQPKGRLSLRSTTGVPSVSLNSGAGATQQTILLGSETTDSTVALSREIAGAKATWPK